MKYTQDGNDFVLKIEKGENVLETILGFRKEHNISAGSILWAVGMIRNLEVGYFNGKQYERDTFGGPLEIVSFHGSIAGNEPHLHIHASAADRGHGVMGGHLFSGTADPLLEVHIRKFEKAVLTRKYNEKTTLTELEPGSQ